MELVKQNWTLADGYQLVEYLQTLANPQKVAWSRNILNTQMPLLAIPHPTLKGIAKQIANGDMQSFLTLQLFETYETVCIYGMVLGYLQDFEEFVFYLNPYLKVVDSWAHCDLLGFPGLECNREKYLALSKQFLNSPLPLTRRVAVIVLLNMAKNPNVLPVVFKTLNQLENENEYYVNMAAAWLLCECFVRYRDQTLSYFQNNNTNKFVINKAISKCRDSFRVAPQDKQMLLQFKRK